MTRALNVDCRALFSSLTHAYFLSEILKAARTEQDYPIIVGGDFNVILDPALVDGAETTEGKTPQN